MASKTSKLETPAFITKDKMENSEDIPLASGVILNFDDFNEYDVEAKQSSILTALSRAKLTERPCMILDLANVNDLGLIVDDKEYKQLENKIARIVLPISQIVDISNIKPPAGSSTIRANGSIPTYRWFQAANLLLHDKDQFGRIIPFPLEQKNGDITYQAIRVSPDEFRKYQDVLKYAVEQDGLHQGFAVAAKFAYEILLERGYKELTFEQVGSCITDIIIMGKSKMNGVLILNSEDTDFEDIKRFSLYF